MNSPIIGVGGIGNIYGMAIGLLAESRKAEAKLSVEEKAQREEQRRLAANERYRKASILRSVCPTCDGKLVRGKKNKKNEYKRDWHCGKCDETHSV